MTTLDPRQKQRGAAKMARIPIKIEPREPLPKPDWIRIKLATTPAVEQLKHLL